MRQGIEQFCKEFILTVSAKPVFKIIASTMLGFFAYFIGMESYGGVEALAFLCLLDVVFAFTVLHKKNKSINSRKLPRKAFDLFVYLVLIGVMHLLSKTSNLFGTFLVNTIIVWFSLTEVLSILEHAAELGYSIPVSLLKNLTKVRDEYNK